MSSKVEIILNNTPFPGAGQQIGGYQVIESMVDVEGKNWAIYLKGKLNQSQVKKALLELTNKHHALLFKMSTAFCPSGQKACYTPVRIHQGMLQS